MPYKFRKYLLCVLVSLGFSQPAFPLAFTPTEFEWLLWTDYCRARYLVSGAGVDSAFTGRVSKLQIENYKRMLGPSWRGLHHYCAARLILERAKKDSSSRNKKHLLESVVGEVDFSIRYVPESHIIHAEHIMTKAQAIWHLGKYDSANNLLERETALHDTYAPIYSVRAVLLRDQGKLDEAIELLYHATEKKQVKSAELHYFLGLFLVENKSYDKALEQAHQAYSLGYPLPGLKNKLKRLGRWKEAS